MVDSVAIKGPDARLFKAGSAAFELPPGESRAIEVCFTPDTVDEFKAALTVYSGKDSLMIPLIGAGIMEPPPCPDPPVIGSITDIPNDQGKQVNVVWNRACADSVGSKTPITSYSVWRRADELNSFGLGKANNHSSNGPMTTESLSAVLADIGNAKPSAHYTFDIDDMSGLSSTGDLWTFVGSSPALQFEQYSLVAPTLYDSTESGIIWSSFFVAAHTNDPVVWFASQPDSGYSVDNLAPSIPSGFMAKTVESTIRLNWEPNPEEDLRHYRIYRSETANFEISKPFAYAIDTVFVDSSAVAGRTYYYRITAADFSGNESEPSIEDSAGVLTSVVNGQELPKNFNLEQNYPNPFNPSTVIAYQIPRAAFVELRIYNMRGQLVRLLVTENQVPGEHRAVWDGRDDAGKQVPSGLYVYRMTADGFTASRKMLLVH